MTDAVTSTPRRPSRFANRVKKPAAAPEAETASEAVEEAAPASDLRPAMRAPMRDEDARARAARRAAEIRGSVGSLDEGMDDFYFNVADVPDGWTYEWKRKITAGAEDPAYQVSLARMGWEPVPADRHPHMMPSNGKFAVIERKGMILMERPKELSDEARMIELKKARQQVNNKKSQLSNAPDGQFGRDHSSVRPKISNTYEPMPIPKD